MAAYPNHKPVERMGSTLLLAGLHHALYSRSSSKTAYSRVSPNPQPCRSATAQNASIVSGRALRLNCALRPVRRRRNAVPCPNFSDRASRLLNPAASASCRSMVRAVLSATASFFGFSSHSAGLKSSRASAKPRSVRSFRCAGTERHRAGDAGYHLDIVELAHVAIDAEPVDAGPDFCRPAAWRSPDPSLLRAAGR